MDIFYRSSLYEAALLFSVRRSNLALKTAAKSCGGRFGLVHSHFCYAAATELQIVVATLHGRYKKLQIIPEK